MNGDAALRVRFGRYMACRSCHVSWNSPEADRWEVAHSVGPVAASSPLEAPRSPAGGAGLIVSCGPRGPERPARTGGNVVHRLRSVRWAALLVGVALIAAACGGGGDGGGGGGG